MVEAQAATTAADNHLQSWNHWRQVFFRKNKRYPGSKLANDRTWAQQEGRLDEWGEGADEDYKDNPEVRAGIREHHIAH